MTAKSFNLADLFETVVDHVTDRPALICGDSLRSYSELEHNANQLAHAMLAAGIKAGDHVGFYLYNNAEHIEALFACFKIAAVPVNVNFRYSGEELKYLFCNADLVACFVSRSLIPHVAEVQASCPQLTRYYSVDDGDSSDLASIGAIDYQALVAGQSSSRDFAERDDQAQVIIYTGGTTGMPKGVMWPHREFFMACLGGGGMMTGQGPAETPADIMERIVESPMKLLTLAPLIHGACLWTALIQLLAGNTLVMSPDKSLKGERVWDLVQAQAVNSVAITGDAMALPLLDALDANPGGWDLSSVFAVSSGGAVFSKSKQDAFKAHLPDCFILNSIGSSEGGQFGSLDESKGDGGLGNCQRSDIQDVILEDVADGEALRLTRDGEDGILARSGNIPIGYYGDEVKTAKSFVHVDGRRWLLTGDAANRDADGVIKVFGRGSNCINSGGEKIFPEEVEMALKANADIFDALVVGMPDERWGSRVVAVISTRDNVELELAAVKAEAKKILSSYKLPRELHHVDVIPRMPNGKPDYKAATAVAAANA